MKESTEMSVDTVQSGLSWQADSCPNSSAVDRGETYWTPVNNSNITILAKKETLKYYRVLEI
jgi:hypothetical protein